MKVCNISFLYRLSSICMTRYCGSIFNFMQKKLVNNHDLFDT